MASFAHLEALRRQNKELLAKLKHKTEKRRRRQLACGSKELAEDDTPERSVSVSNVSKGFSLGTSNTREPAPLTERHEGLLNVSDAVVTVAVHPQAARNALCRPGPRVNTTKAAGPAEEKPNRLADNCGTASTPVPEQRHTSEDPTYDRLLQDQGSTRLRGQRDTAGLMQSKSGISQDKDRRGVGRVRFPSPDQDLETVSETERRRVQPLLGYDWIAGLLDAESSLTERSEQFFSELRTFRQVNKEECVHSQYSGLPVEAGPWTFPVEEDVTEHERALDTHQCTFCYRINSRLFAAPLDPQAACPICKMPKEKHPHTEKEPAFIRVSIPRSTLLPAYRYKAHRRCSFDPSDSLGLPSHCLSGWSDFTVETYAEMSSLDLRSGMEIGPNAGTVPSAHPEDQLDLSGSRVSGSQRSDQLLDVSRLARYRFQHLATTRTKPNKSSYPVY